MTLTIIPDSAPFSAEQRAWLNGFLAGWTGLDELGQAKTIDANGVATDSQQLSASKDIEEQPVQEEEFPWHDPNLELEERLKLAEGRPLNRQLMAAMAQLDCGACGYLCETYSAAIASGEEKCLTLCAPGGKETAKTLKKIVKEQPTSSSATEDQPDTNGHVSRNGQSEPNPIASTKAGISRSNPYLAKLKECYNLNGHGSVKHTCHVVIDLEGSDLCYRVGDSLGVYPTNCPELVEKLLAALSTTGEEVVTAADGNTTTLHKALLQKCDLHDVPEELCELLLRTTSKEEERSCLQQHLNDDTLDEFDVLDVLQLAPTATVDLARLTAVLNPLQPRLYSIASSLRSHPDEVHLTIGKVCCELGGRLRKGVASTMFAERLKAGDEVSVFVHKSNDFTVPINPDAPMIMVGPGTGIAPFRAFLEERAATKATGKNWLFFGDQHESTDFLYQQELEQMVASGTLTHLTTAFSRDQEEKIYVQDRMLQLGAELFHWLEEGGYFFVCGDAKRMASDVDQALHMIVAEHGRMSAEQATEYVTNLKRSRRYVRDVY